VRRLLAALLLLAACAASPKRAGPPQAPPPAGGDVEQLYVQLFNYDIEFRGLTLQEGVSDACTRVRQLRDNICELATRICRITEKEPPGSSAAERCADGKVRCQKAIERADARGCRISHLR
jgi:hypothetical protein